MKKFYKEPLLHFILIGAVFFLLYAWVGENDTTKDEISIDENDLEEIVSKFEMQLGRIPTEDEMISLVAKKIEEEVFYKEALKMNLDHNDEILKRRLAQKMKSLTKDIATVIEPSAAELLSYFKQHTSKYLLEANYSFYQIFFSPDRRENWRNDASIALKNLKNKSLETALNSGDPIAVPKQFKTTSSFHVTRQMGQEFANALVDLKTNEWQGPIESGYGAHLVYITSKSDEKPAPFESVKDAVYKDYTYEKQQEVKASIYKEFVKKYELNFDIQSDQFTEDFVAKMKSKILEN